MKIRTWPEQSDPIRSVFFRVSSFLSNCYQPQSFGWSLVLDFVSVLFTFSATRSYSHQFSIRSGKYSMPFLTHTLTCGVLVVLCDADFLPVFVELNPYQ